MKAAPQDREQRYSRVCWEVPGADRGRFGPLPKPAFRYRFSLPGGSFESIVGTKMWGVMA